MPKLDKVLLFPMPEAATRTAALLAGQVDWIEVPAPDAHSAPQAGRHGDRHQQVLRTTGPTSPAWSRARRGPTSACARRPTSRSIAPAIAKLLGGLMIEAKGAGLSRPSLVRLAELRHQVRSRGGARSCWPRRATAKTKKPKIKIAISTSGSGQMLPLPMNEYVQENLNAVGFDIQSFEVMDGTRWCTFGFQPVTGEAADQGRHQRRSTSAAPPSIPISALHAPLPQRLRRRRRAPTGAS